MAAQMIGLSWLSGGLRVVLGVVVFWLSSSFVLIGGDNESRLDVSPAEPKVQFYWQGVPVISHLQFYRGGGLLPAGTTIEDLIDTEQDYIGLTQKIGSD